MNAAGAALRAPAADFSWLTCSALLSPGPPSIPADMAAGSIMPYRFDPADCQRRQRCASTASLPHLESMTEIRHLSSSLRAQRSNPEQGHGLAMTANAIGPTAPFAPQPRRLVDRQVVWLGFSARPD